jgi:acetyltransferase-like isoleucine patch superfamily enzyme
LVGKPLRRWLYQANGIEARSKGIETGTFFSGNAVVFGRRCYINARCFFVGVTEPITIGDDCAPHGLYGGVPAKRIKDLPI